MVDGHVHFVESGVFDDFATVYKPHLHKFTYLINCTIHKHRMYSTFSKCFGRRLEKIGGCDSLCFWPLAPAREVLAHVPPENFEI